MSVQRILHLALAAVLCVTLSSCDLLGSDDSPGWTGDYEVVEFGNGEVPSDPTYWSLTKDKLEIIDVEDGGCDIGSSEIRNTDGNRATLATGGQVRFEKSDGQLTATFLSTGNSTVLESVDSDPRDLAGC